MKRLPIILILLLFTVPCLAGTITIGKKKGGACTPEASGTVLVGSSTEGAGAGGATSGTTEYLNTNFTATWAGDCTTQTIGTIEIFMRGVGATTNCKALWANSDGTLVTNGISNAIALEWEASLMWKVFTMGTPPTVTKDTGYKIGLICDAGDWELGYVDTGALTLCQGTSNYTSPATFSCDYSEDTSSAVGAFRGKK